MRFATTIDGLGGRTVRVGEDEGEVLRKPDTPMADGQNRQCDDSELLRHRRGRQTNRRDSVTAAETGTRRRLIRMPVARSVRFSAGVVMRGMIGGMRSLRPRV